MEVQGIGSYMLLHTSLQGLHVHASIDCLSSICRLTRVQSDHCRQTQARCSSSTRISAMWIQMQAQLTVTIVCDMHVSHAAHYYFYLGPCRWTPQSLEKLDKAQQAADAADSQLHIHVLPNAGHWVHVDNPHGLLDMMLPSFINPAK